MSDCNCGSSVSRTVEIVASILSVISILGLVYAAIKVSDILYVRAANGSKWAQYAVVFSVFLFVVKIFLRIFSFIFDKLNGN